MGSRSLLVVAGAVAVLLAGCGGARHGVAQEPAPPLRAIDAPLPKRLLIELKLIAGMPVAARNSGQTAIDAVCFARKNGKPHPCTVDAKTRARLARQERDLGPAQGATPRLVAELPLGGGRREVLAAWSTRLDRLCLMSSVEPFGGGTGPFGPCLAAAARDAGLPQAPGALERCDAICVVSGGSGADGNTVSYVLVGMLAPSATSLRVTLAGGAVRVYPLRGPLLRESGRRLFMAALGARDWRTLALLRGDVVIARRTMPAELARVEDCQTRFGNSGDSVMTCMRVATGGAFPP